MLKSIERLNRFDTEELLDLGINKLNDIYDDLYNALDNGELEGEFLELAEELFDKIDYIVNNY